MAHNWQNVLISSNDSIQQAIEVIDKEGLRVALVVDKQTRLLGIVTDGDVRRGLVRHLSLDNPVKDIMNTTPKIGSICDSKAKLLAIMEEFDLLQIPIIENGVVIGLETIQHLMGAKKLNNPVFLMAGGFGTRLHPLTRVCPKPLLKIGEKPILETIMEGFIASGFHQFYISTHYMSEMIHNHFGDGSRWGVSISYIHEEKPLGTGGALALLPDNLPDLPIIMMNADILTKVNTEKLLAFHQEGKADITVCVRKYEMRVPYGVVQNNEQLITSIIEKPIYNHFVNAGIYVLNNSIRKMLFKNKYLDMPTLITQAIAKKEKVLMFPIHEYWLDVGRHEDFNQAQHDFALDFA